MSASRPSVRGPRTVYPFAITKEDFGFDSDNMNIAKWFLCLCAARARSVLMWAVVFAGV